MKNQDNTVVVSQDVKEVKDLTAQLISKSNEVVNSSKDTTIGVLKQQVSFLEDQLSASEQKHKVVEIRDNWGRPSFINAEDLKMLIRVEEKQAAVDAVAEEIDELKKFKRDTELREEVARKEELRRRELQKEEHNIAIIKKDNEINKLKNETNILKDNIEIRAHKLEMTYQARIEEKEKQIEKLQDKLNDKSAENRRNEELKQLQQSITEQKAEIEKLQSELSSKSLKSIFRRLFGKTTSFGKILRVTHDTVYNGKTGNWDSAKVVYFAI